MTFRIFLGLSAFFLLSACNSPADKSGSIGLSDPNASPMAVALFQNLEKLSGEYTLLAHQDALAYGMGWKGDEFRTDINDVAGDHPAMFGWDLGHLGDTLNIDSVPFEDMKKWAIAAYQHGGINTYSWHMRNYAMGGSSWDRDSCVEACLPGGAVHELYVEKLEQAAEFFGSLKNESGELIPVIFRPFHEMSGNWFWWGNGNCSPEQYKEIFRFTIDFFRVEKNMHQLIVVYGPGGGFRNAENFMKFYPGDAYVDVMAFDDYSAFSTTEKSKVAIKQLEILDSLSTAHHKLMAIAETGVETIPNDKWFTEVVRPVLNANESTRKAAWILFWRNGRPDHFYGPFPGHPSAPDFIEFMDDPRMLSLSELPEMYQ